MKLLKKKGVAITIMIAAILLSSLYGLSKRPQVEVPEGGEALNESLSTAAFAPYLVDQADVLSSSQEETINLYNANWDSMVGSILSVVTVDTVTGDMEDAAYGWADSLELGSNDAILLMAWAAATTPWWPAAPSTTAWRPSPPALWTAPWRST